jgi:hypothetical protein
MQGLGRQDSNLQPPVFGGKRRFGFHAGLSSLRARLCASHSQNPGVHRVLSRGRGQLCANLVDLSRHSAVLSYLLFRGVLSNGDRWRRCLGLV